MARLHVPLSTLRRRPYDCLRMTRGQGDWLGLPCTTLSFATPRRFSTAHSRHGPPHIAVGTGLTASPPHGPVQAALPHTVLTSGGWRGPDPSHSPRPGPRAFPALCPERGLLRLVPLGWPPSLHHLRRLVSAVFVRWLLRYYAAM